MLIARSNLASAAASSTSWCVTFGGPVHANPSGFMKIRTCIPYLPYLPIHQFIQAYRVLSSDPVTQKHSRLNRGVMGTGLFTTNRIVLTPEYNREVSKGPLRARDSLCCESDRTTIQRTSAHRQRHIQCIHFLLYYPKSAGRRCLPLLSLLMILILGTVAGFSIWQASKLTPPRDAEKWLPPNHMMQMV